MRPTQSARFIGRHAELAALERAIASASNGDAPVVLVAGEAGVGKSRLVNEAILRARRQAVRVLVGGCVSLADEAAPLAPVAEALRGLEADIGTGALIERAGPARDALSGLLPGLARNAGEQPTTGLMYESAQDRLSAHLIDFLLRLADVEPVVMVVEDIHWADRATLDTLRLLARNVGAKPFVLVATYRSDEEDRDGRLRSFTAELERSTDVMRLGLSRFDRAETAEQVHAILGAQLDQDRLEQIFVRSEGNPFYAEQLLAGGASTNTLPETLRELLEARIGSLTSGARSIACAIAVHERPISEVALRRVAGLPAARFTESLRQLLDRKVLEWRPGDGGDVLAFRHALLQEAAYAGLLATERLAMHAALASGLEERLDTNGADPFAWADLARHWEAAGDQRRAVKAALRAASAAETVYAPALAAEQYERALRLADVAGDSADRLEIDLVELLERAAHAAAAVGSARAIDHIERALALVDEESDPIRAGLLNERLGRYRWYAADGAGALAAYEHAIRLVPPQPPSAARARVSAGLAQVLMIHARFEESMPLCAEAVAAARVVGDRAIESHATNTLGTNTAYLGDAEGGLDLLWASKAMAEEIGNVEDVGRAYANIVDVLRVAGRFAEAADLGRKSFAYQRAHGLTTVYGLAVLQYSAWALHCLARWDEARAALAEARLHPGDMNDRIMGLAMLALVEASQGELSAAESHVDMARPLLENVIDTQLLLPYAEAAAEVYLWGRRPEEALHAVSDAVARAQPPIGANISRFGPVYALGVRAAADALTESRAAPDAARALAEQVAEVCLAGMTRAHDQISQRWPGYVRLSGPYVALCAAERTRMEGKHAADAWAAAAEATSGLALRYVAAYARWREGEAILQRGGRVADARPVLSDAHHEASAIGAEPLRGAIEAVAKRAGIHLAVDVRPSTRGVAYGLTPREVEVLRLLTAGHSNRQIGEALFITDKTASVHVSNILAKFGVSRRGEAVAVAAELGLATWGVAD